MTKKLGKPVKMSNMMMILRHSNYDNCNLALAVTDSNATNNKLDNKIYVVRKIN